MQLATANGAFFDALARPNNDGASLHWAAGQGATFSAPSSIGEGAAASYRPSIESSTGSVDRTPSFAPQDPEDATVRDLGRLAAAGFIPLDAYDAGMARIVAIKRARVVDQLTRSGLAASSGGSAPAPAAPSVGAEVAAPGAVHVLSVTDAEDDFA